MSDMDMDAQMVYLRLLEERGCKFLFKTVLFGKPYVWVEDKTGHIFLERIPDSA